MTKMARSTGRSCTAFALIVFLLTPMMSLIPTAANAQLFPQRQTTPAPAKKGMSTGTKILLIGGAALLYYLYRKHQAAKAAQEANGGVAANGRMPQLYRSRNGGIYYRDAQHRPVWLTVPQQSVQVPASDVQRYAPDYQRYNGPAPSAPAGYRTQSFSDLDGGFVAPRGPVSHN